MSDLISRQAAIVQTSKIIWDDAVAHDVKEVLKDLPSAQPEPCEDAVSREAVIAKLKDMRKHGDMIPWEGKRVFEAIRHLPSAQPQWIPCSERLPENRLYVLVTYKYEYGLIDHGITWYGQVEGKWNTSREVIAWMPLPKPYGGESE